MEMISNQKFSIAQSSLKLALWQAEAESTTSSQFYVELQKFGLPKEIVSRLHELISFTKKITGKVFAIGKILLLKIIEFVKAHPLMITGAGIGYVISAVIAGLITSIPFLGTILAPLATLLGITITMTGMVCGHKLDKCCEEVSKNLTEIVQAFFSLFSSVFNTVFDSIITT
jgi:hypothetical protein